MNTTAVLCPEETLLQYFFTASALSFCVYPPFHDGPEPLTQMSCSGPVILELLILPHFNKL